jgi:glycosyltransferase involved in cell wall biosynthesis
VTEISVIVPARDASKTISATMRALEAQTEDAEVIVVDDGSRDDTAEVARSSRLRPTVIELDGGGPDQARNAGARAASGSLLAFTDADCEPDPGWLAAGLKHAIRADLIQGRVTPSVPAGPFDRKVAVTHETGLYETANLFVRKALFERAGGFNGFVDSSAGAHFGEDALFGWACRRLGAESAFAPDAVVRHAVFPRGPAGYVKERWRVWMFPRLVREIPELRRAFLYRGLFLTSRSAALDLAVIGLITALVLGTAWPGLAAVPYLVQLGSTGIRWRRRGPIVAVVQLAADVVALAALIYGSVRARRVVL